MPQRFNGSWRAVYPDEPQYTGHVRIEIRNNSVHMITGDIFLNTNYDGWWQGSNMRLSSNRLTLRYTILSTNGQRYGGSLDLTMQNSNSITGRYTDDNNGGTGRFSLTKIGTDYRQITAEVDSIAGVPALPTVNHQGRTWGLRDIYTNIGIDLAVNPSNTNIPDPGSPLSRADIHNIMVNNRNPNQGPPWGGYLLLATLSSENLLGVMFDRPPRPTPSREGAAVFVNQFPISYPTLSANQRDRLILRTAAHEFGHALNMGHPSTANRGVTIMNQTGVIRSQPGWPNNFRYEFRDINAEHLRHHRQPLVAFGGELASRYPHDFLPSYENSTANHAVDRRISVSVESDTKLLNFSDPWYFRISIKNESTSDIVIEDHLELSAGLMRLIVHRPDGETRLIQPSMSDDFVPRPYTLGPNERKTQDAVLLVDRNGPVFDIPGVYRIQAEYSGMLDAPWSASLSRELLIRVRYPTGSQERAMLELHRFQVRMYFELGGADHLTGDLEILHDLAEDAALQPLKVYLLLVNSLRLGRPFHDLVNNNIRYPDAQEANKFSNEALQLADRSTDVTRFLNSHEKKE